jgi:hypothetical protein
MKRTVLSCALAWSCSGLALAYFPPPWQCDNNVAPNPQQPTAQLCAPQNQAIPLQLQAHPAQSSWISGAWVRDPRPMAFIPFFDAGGSWRNNSYYLSTWWHMTPAATLGDPSDDYIDERRDDYAYNENGELILQENGVADQIDELLKRMNNLYKDGFRRMVLRMPAGNVFGRVFHQTGRPDSYGGHDVSVNQWGPMAQWKQNELSSHDGAFQTWLRTHTDASLELYAGAPLGDDYCTTCVNAPSFAGSQPILQRQWIYQGNEDPIFDSTDRWYFPCNYQYSARAFDPRYYASVVQMYLAINPWIVNGVKMVWYDAASDNSLAFYRYGFMEWSYNPYFRSMGVRFGGEALPLVGGDPDNIDGCALTSAPWMSLQQNFFVGPVANRQWRHTWSPTFDRDEIETHILVSDETFGWEHFREARYLGLIPTIMNCTGLACEREKRWYSMGVIRIADFNGDGAVTQDDQNMFMAAYIAAQSQTPPIVVFATGDVTGDGQIDGDDLGLFSAAFSCEFSHNCDPNVELSRNYGVADDL